MASRSTVVNSFASMVSDSELDFDDVEVLKPPPRRGMDKIISAGKGIRAKAHHNADRVTKPTQRLGRSIRGRIDPSTSTVSRYTLGEKDVNHPLSKADQKKGEKFDPHSDAEECIDGRLFRGDDRASDAFRQSPCTKTREFNRIDSPDTIPNDEHIEPEISDGQMNFDTMSLTKEQVQQTMIGHEAVMEPGVRHSSASARRFLGELKKKYYVLEARHADLLSIGIKNAERNFERLKKQSDETTAASNELIRELKEKIAAQAALLKQNDAFRHQLERSKANASKLEETVDGLTNSLSQARSEIQSLSVKLTTSRAAQASSSLSGNAVRNGSGGLKSVPSEALMAAQAKEDLYGDLTGLIVRAKTKKDGEDVFDCIQTGRNGSLHFKLSLESGNGPSAYDDVQLTYSPQLDESRDDDLVRLLPSYLIEEITFTRAQAPNFYSKLNKSLTKRIESEP